MCVIDDQQIVAIVILFEYLSCLTVDENTKLFSETLKDNLIFSIFTFLH